LNFGFLVLMLRASSCECAGLGNLRGYSPGGAVRTMVMGFVVEFEKIVTEFAEFGVIAEGAQIDPGRVDEVECVRFADGLDGRSRSFDICN
jgi:hypothetical protein